MQILRYCFVWRSLNQPVLFAFYSLIFLGVDFVPRPFYCFDILILNINLYCLNITFCLDTESNQRNQCKSSDMRTAFALATRIFHCSYLLFCLTVAQSTCIICFLLFIFPEVDFVPRPFYYFDIFIFKINLSFACILLSV